MSHSTPAPAQQRVGSPLARIAVARVLIADAAQRADRPANDNFPFAPARRRTRLFEDAYGQAGPSGGFGMQDTMLKAALSQFARHGIGAAREARKQAERAFFAGDREAYDWWHSVCHALDRRLAAQMHRATIADGAR